MNVNSKEEIIWEGSQSQVLNIGKFTSGLILTVVIVILSAIFFLPAIVLSSLVIAYMFYFWLKIKFKKYKITTERIFFTEGIFSKKTDALELYRVKDLDVYEPFWMRIFRVGNIKLSTSDDTTPVFTLLAIPSPPDLMNKLRINIEKRRDEKRVRGIEFLDESALM
jgi:uncharacterized membrane protein YdbT with pleckstrin-like domain